MAITLTATGTFSYSDTVTSAEVTVPDVAATIATAKYLKLKQLVTTSEVAINLGGIAAPAWCCLINRDTTNYIELKVATAGAIFGKLLPGEWAMLRLGSGAQVPYAIANTASCYLEIFICSL